MQQWPPKKGPPCGSEATSSVLDLEVSVICGAHYLSNAAGSEVLYQYGTLRDRGCTGINPVEAGVRKPVQAACGRAHQSVEIREPSQNRRAGSSSIAIAGEAAAAMIR